MTAVVLDLITLLAGCVFLFIAVRMLRKKKQTTFAGLPQHQKPLGALLLATGIITFASSELGTRFRINSKQDGKAKVADLRIEEMKEKAAQQELRFRKLEQSVEQLIEDVNSIDRRLDVVEDSN